ncbi:MAG: VOC family protein [Micropepsaceae bacterium]
MTRMTASLTPFHIAFPVHDLAAARAFYGETLGLPQGRSSDSWIDYDLFGHQIVAHLKPGTAAANHVNPVDGHDVPVPHFGVVLEWTAFHAFAGKLRNAGIAFLIEPCIRFEGQPGEQATMFFLDPSGNALEFKSFRDPAKLFATT